MKNKESSLEEAISFFGSPTYRIAEGLREEGYGIAGHMGVKVPLKKQPPFNMIGILKEREPIQKNFHGIKYNQNQRALYLATLWINNEEKKAIGNKNWVLEINDEEYETKLIKLVKKLSLPYNVKVQATLINGAPREETYLSDLYR